MRYLAIFLILISLASLAFGVESWVIAGAGTGADASTNNGGGYITGGTAVWSTSQATNGGPTVFINNQELDIRSNGGIVQLSDTANGGTFTTNMVVGQIQNINFSNTVNYTSARHTISSIEDADTWTINLTYIADEDGIDHDVWSGGALPNPGDVPDSDDIAVGEILAAGDKVWVRAIADFTTEDESGSILFVNTAGTASAPIIWEAHFAEISSEEGDFGIVTFDGTGHTNCIETAVGGSVHHVIIGIRCENATDDGANLNTVEDDAVTFIRCQFNNNGAWGVQGDNNITAIFCDFDGNGSGGLDGDFTIVSVGSVYRTNTGDGVFAATACIVGNLLFDNTDTAVRISGSSALVYGNTIDGDDGAGTEGILQDSASGLSWTAINNILTDCVVGIQDDSTLRQGAVLYNNLYNSNTTDTSASITPVPSDSDIWGNIVDPANMFQAADSNLGDPYILHSNNKDKGVDAQFTLEYWEDFNAGVGNNPPTLTSLSGRDGGGLERIESAGGGVAGFGNKSGGKQ